METQSLIELRRLDAIESPSDTSAHGDYTVVLKQPVVLNEGDSVILNRSFIDTRAQLGNVITFQSDVVVSGKYIVWLQNWWDSTTGKNEVQMNQIPLKTVADLTLVDTFPDGFGPFNNPGFFVACKAPTFTESTTQQQMIGFPYNYNNTLTTGKYIPIEIYSDRNNPTQLTRATQLWINPGQAETEIRTTKVSYILGTVNANNDFIKSTDQDVAILNLDTFNDITAIEYTKPVFDADGPLVPIEFEFSITIPAGSYTPTSLAQAVTSRFSVDTNQELSTELTGSQFMKESSLIDAFVQVWDETGVPDSYRKFDAYGINFFSILDADQIYTGASQTSLEFDTDSNTFRFTYLHTPIEDPDGAPSVKEIKWNFAANPPPNQTPPPIWLASAHSGIAFTSLEPKSFWQDTLGFDLSTILVDNNWQYRIRDIGGKISQIGTPIISLVPGKNITTAFEGSAQVLVNNTSDTKLPVNYFYVSNPRAEYINTNLTTAIVANPLPPQSTDTSHYLVEVSGVPMSQMITSKTQTFSLAGVVGRYQTRGSFTEGGGGDGAPTQILGNSVILSKLNVRILNPDRTPVTDMGPQSTIFLTLTRQVQLPPPLPPVLAAQPPGLLPPPEQPGEDEPPAKKAK